MATPAESLQPDAESPLGEYIHALPDELADGVADELAQGTAAGKNIVAAQKLRSTHGPAQSLKGVAGRKIATDTIQLMESGYSLADVATQMGIKRERLQKLVDRELDRQVIPHVDRYRALQMNRYERIIRGIETAAFSGDLFAIDRMRAVMKDINDLLGLKAPVTANLNVSMEHSEKRTVRVEISDKIAEISRKLGGLPAGHGEMPTDEDPIVEGELVEGLADGHEEEVPAP